MVSPLSIPIGSAILTPIGSDRQHPLSECREVPDFRGSVRDDRHPSLSDRARESALATASALFYSQGVRAVGMDLIVERSGIAKTTIYRHFSTKDALIEAFLEREDVEFWQQWDDITGPHAGSPRDALMALCEWIGSRISRDSYRGCPQINVAAEFADAEHPARQVARRHKAEMVRRLADLCRDIEPATAEICALQVGLLFDGAFTSHGRLRDFDAPSILRDAVNKLLPMTTRRRPKPRG
jgi:AcrR family transcriptional regulator